LVSRRAAIEGSDSEEDEDEETGGEDSSDGEDGGVEVDSEEYDMEDASSENESDSGPEDSEEADSDQSEDEDELSSEASSTSPPRDQKGDSQREELKRLMNEEQQQIVSRLSLASEADEARGRAVMSQRTAFDALLNTRIRLQKALIAVNSLDAVKEQGAEHGSPELSSAEEAAFELWETLGNLRSSLSKSDNSHTNGKRKRDELELSDMWQEMQALEAKAKSNREAVLSKWSTKVRGAEQLPLTKSFDQSSSSQSLIPYLKSQLMDSDRLVKRTQLPRACAPQQAAKRVASDPQIFDDADFYQLLLKELVDQRMADSQLNSTAKARWTAAREAKSKKIVDTRASKGRKLKYTVHEKLQNFMAPVDSGTWGERQIDELFSSLLGRRTKLQDDEEEASDDDEEVDGRLLFRVA
jgi:protein AATF/BFR2